MEGEGEKREREKKRVRERNIDRREAKGMENGRTRKRREGKGREELGRENRGRWVLAALWRAPGVAPRRFGASNAETLR